MTQEEADAVSEEFIEQRRFCAQVAREFDKLPFAMQQSGGLPEAIAEAIENGTTAEGWARSVNWPPGVKEPDASPL